MRKARSLGLTTRPGPRIGPKTVDRLQDAPDTEGQSNDQADDQGGWTGQQRQPGR